MKPINVLIVDDEPPARLNLQALVQEHDDLRVVGLCASGREALDLLAETPVDLLLLDVRMPGMAGLDVARRLDPGTSPFVVFVTAYERHALEAFDLAATDYVLKPVSRRRLAETLRRVRQSLARRPTAPVDRLVIRSGRQRHLVPLAEVRRVEACGNYVRVESVHGEYLHRGSLHEIERLLPEAQFTRVHRSTLVRADAVRALEVQPGGGHVVVLDGGSEAPVSRRRVAVVRELLTGGD